MSVFKAMATRLVSITFSYDDTKRLYTPNMIANAQVPSRTKTNKRERLPRSFTALRVNAASVSAKSSDSNTNEDSLKRGSNEFHAVASRICDVRLTNIT